MAFIVPISKASEEFPAYEFIAALTPSSQKAAFHVKDKDGASLCLKIISPDYNVDRLHREIVAMQSIDHPNIVKLKEYTYSSRPGMFRHYIIEQYIEGCDLADIIVGGQLSISRTINIFSQLCDGLHVLRKHSIVHRDLKPHNIRIQDNDCPVIIDFGLARLLEMPDLTLTQHGARIGTPLYFAPEQFDGSKHDIDHRTDLFALGTLLYEAAVGIHPFSEHSGDMDLLRKAVCESSQHLERKEYLSLTKKMRLLISRLLERDRSRRPYDAGQVATMLRRLGVTK